MDRRQYLRGVLAAAAVSVAGCNSDGEDTPTPTEAATPTPTDTRSSPTRTGDDDDGQDIDPEAPIDEDVIIQISMDGDFANLQGKISTALSNEGLDDNISIEILPGDFETDSRRSSFQSALDANRASPDIFMMNSGWTIPFIVREQVVNLENALTSDTLSYIKNSYLPAMVNTASDPESGDLYGLPLFQDYPMMHYRKDLVEEAGYDPESNNWATEPMSWKEFADMAKDIWDQNGGPDGDFTYAFTTQGANYEGTACCTFNEMMTSFGGAYFGDHENLFGPVGDRPITVDEQPVIDTIRVMRSFMHGPDADDAHPDYPQISNSDIVEFTEEPSREPFTEGNAIFHRNWPYAVPINLGETETDPAFDPGATTSCRSRTASRRAKASTREREGRVRRWVGGTSRSIRTPKISAQRRRCSKRSRTRA